MRVTQKLEKVFLPLSVFTIMWVFKSQYTESVENINSPRRKKDLLLSCHRVVRREGINHSKANGEKCRMKRIAVSYK